MADVIRKNSNGEHLYYGNNGSTDGWFTIQELSSQLGSHILAYDSKEANRYVQNINNIYGGNGGFEAINEHQAINEDSI